MHNPFGNNSIRYRPAAGQALCLFAAASTLPQGRIYVYSFIRLLGRAMAKCGCMEFQIAHAVYIRTLPKGMIFRKLPERAFHGFLQLWFSKCFG